MGILACLGSVTLPFRSKKSVDQFPPPYGAFRPYLAFEPVEEFPSGTRAIPKTVSNDSLGSSLTLVPSPKASPNPSVGRSMDLSVEHLSGPYEGATFVTLAQIHRSASEETLVPSPKMSLNPSLGSSMDLRVEHLSGPYEGATFVTQTQIHRSASEDTLVPSLKDSPNPSLGSSLDLSVEHLSDPFEGATFVTQPQFHRSASENTLVPSPESWPVPSLKGLSLKAFLASLDDRSSVSELQVDQPSVRCEEVTFLSRAELRRVASEFSLECSLTSSSLPTSPVLPPKTGKDPSPGKSDTSSRGRKVWARIRKALTACLYCYHTCQESEDIPL